MPFTSFVAFFAPSSKSARSASEEKPEKTTECGAPTRAQASTATTASGTMGR